MAFFAPLFYREAIVRDKTYSFSTVDAVNHGIDSAIILHNMRYWLDYAKAHGEMMHDGYYWMFASAPKMVELFPFWTANKIQKMLKKLEDDGVIISGNYNSNKFDRTKWYTMEEYSIQPNGGIPFSQTADSTFSQTADSLYDQYKDSNSNKRSTNHSSNSSSEKNQYPDEFEWIWKNKPEREGGNPKKRAYSACKARLKAGSTWRDLAEGMKRYKSYCGQKRIIGTSGVQQMATFFGPDEFFKENWTVNHEANTRSAIQSPNGRNSSNWGSTKPAAERIADYCKAELARRANAQGSSD